MSLNTNLNASLRRLCSPRNTGLQNAAHWSPISLSHSVMCWVTPTGRPSRKRKSENNSKRMNIRQQKTICSFVFSLYLPYILLCLATSYVKQVTCKCTSRHKSPTFMTKQWPRFCLCLVLRKWAKTEKSDLMIKNLILVNINCLF